MPADDPTTTARLQRLRADTRAVARAIALLWTWRSRAAILQTLGRMDVRMSTGKPFTQEGVRDCIHELKNAALLIEQPLRQGFFQLADEARATLYREVLDAVPVDDLRLALQRDHDFPRGSRYGWQPFSETADVATHRGREDEACRRGHDVETGCGSQDALVAGHEQKHHDAGDTLEGEVGHGEWEESLAREEELDRCDGQGDRGPESAYP